MTFPLINGRAYDYSCLETIPLPLLGIVKAITEISYSDTLEKGEFAGMAPHLLALTPGQYRAEASMTIEKQYHTAFITALQQMAAPFGGDIRHVKFPLMCMYASPGMPIITDKLIDCQWGGGEQSNSQGTDALVVTVPLRIKAVFWNGVNPLGISALDLGVSPV